MPTKIQWADEVWNPVTGCTQISPGCKHCYAKEMARRLQAMGQPKYANGFEVNLHPDELEKPLRWRKPRRIFVCSMSDLFHEDVPNEFIAAVFGVMGSCPQHTWLVLTKRAERMASWFAWLDEPRPNSNWEPVCWYPFGVELARFGIGTNEPLRHAIAGHPKRVGGESRWPLPNVHLGVSVENQKHTDRLRYLFECPAEVWWASVEPMLTHLDLRPWLEPIDPQTDTPRAGYAPIAGLEDLAGNCLDWIVCGSESGPDARPMDIDWARSLRDQCCAAGVPFFLKQADLGHGIVKMPALEGRVWDQYPEVTT